MTNDSSSQSHFVLNDGTFISLVSLEQHSTYGGMLEGYPNLKINRWIIDQNKEDLGKHCVVIKPREVKPQDQENAPDDWLELPSVTCIARFRSNSLAEFGSRLSVVWFQDAYAFPIDPEVREEMLRIKWAEVAEAIDDF